jgi:N-acetylglucosamine-6-phosphate deacetylase
MAMNKQSISALDVQSGKPITVSWTNGRITGLTPGGDAGTRVITPALCDIQVNGYAGVDFQNDAITSDELHTAADKLLLAGCSQILLTLITDEWTALTNRFRRIRELRDRSPRLRAAFPGFHIEGPFLSGEPGFKGAHDPSRMIDPTPEKIRELRAVAGDDPLLLTLAPERAGAIDAIKLAVSLGIRVSCGHTNAPAEILAAAARAGATMFTHLGNGCPQQLDRHDNVLWRVIDTPGLTAGIIPDCIHVSPMLFRILNRALAPDRFYYTTDCMSAAGGPPGRYTIGVIEVEVGADKVVRQPGKTNFAGSALTPIEGVFRSARMLNCSWQQSWNAFSVRPRGLMGLSGGLEMGAVATFCVLEPQAATPSAPIKMDVYLGGECKQTASLNPEC